MKRLIIRLVCPSILALAFASTGLAQTDWDGTTPLSLGPQSALAIGLNSILPSSSANFFETHKKAVLTDAESGKLLLITCASEKLFTRVATKDTFLGCTVAPVESVPQGTASLSLISLFAEAGKGVTPGANKPVHPVCNPHSRAPCD